MIKALGAAQDDLFNRVLIVSSLLVGLSVSFMAYVLVLQTPEISGTRLALAGCVFLAFSTANYLFATQTLKERLKAVLARRPLAFLLDFNIREVAFNWRRLVAIPAGGDVAQVVAQRGRERLFDQNVDAIFRDFLHRGRMVGSRRA